MESTKIYIVSHKSEEELKKDGYCYIHVGDNIKNSSLLCDNTGNNIASKNSTYCELTALYWIWKNAKFQNVGLVHYRRFFLSKKSNVFKFHFLDKKVIENILNNYDMILPKKYKCKETIYENYCLHHFGSDLNDIRKIIEKKFPDYLESYNYIIYHQKSFYTRNMFIGKKEVVDKYCSWLFAILFEFEQNVDLTNRDLYQRRIFGFISERLFNVWLYKNKIKIKENKIGFTYMSPLKDFFRRNVSSFIQLFRW